MRLPRRPSIARLVRRIRVAVRRHVGAARPGHEHDRPAARLRDPGRRRQGPGLSFQVVNLRNQADRNVQDGGGFGGVTAPQQYDRYGRQFLLGLSYKL